LPFQVVIVLLAMGIAALALAANAILFRASYRLAFLPRE
jgi:hypothetical protein